MDVLKHSKLWVVPPPVKLRNELGLPRAFSLNEVLRSTADISAHRLGYTFLADGETEAGRLTYGELDQKARALAATLQGCVRPGDRVLVLFPPGLDFIAAFFGCLYAGAIAVPLYPPRFRRSDPRLHIVTRDCTPRAALTTAAVAAQAAAGDLPPLNWITVEEIEAGAADDWVDPAAGPDSIAFLQYTSGSTGNPKGVIVTHGNLLHNQEAIRWTFGQNQDSRIVGWLPLYHDMGLIGNVLQPLWVGAPCILMSPVAFLQRPRRWLEAISRYRATASGGPNFAYDLCERKIAPAEREGLDLSSWAVAFSGAEPVRAQTLERFGAAFAPYGFSPRAFAPCYGLAEATLLVSGTCRGEPHQTSAFDAAALEQNRVEPTAADHGIRLVGNGPPCPDQRVLIVDPVEGTPCPIGRVGEIWIKGPNVALGYWGQLEETEGEFGAHLANGEGPFLRTGDLGFLAPDHGGELFVTGRLKDLIILRGRNHYPQDIEQTVEACHPLLLRSHGAAAFSVEIEGGERLVVVQEIERHARRLLADEAERLAESVRQAVAEEHEVPLWELALVQPGAVPRTSSGKIRRRACREMYIAGTLAFVARLPLEREVKEATSRDISAGDQAAALRSLSGADRQAALIAWLRSQAARVLCQPEISIDRGQPLTALGLDSLSAMELVHVVEAVLGVTLPFVGLLAGASLDSLAAEVDLHLEDSTSLFFGEPGPELGDHPLSSGQEALWFLERLAPGSGAYHISGAARVTTPLDRAAFERALHRLTARHPVLRTVLMAPGGQPVQRVLPELSPELTWEDASGCSEAEALSRLEEKALLPFSLDRGPLLRVLGLARPAGEHLVGFTLHHTMADFWSLGILVREWGALYREESGDRPARLSPLAARYSDYARRQAAWLASPEGERELVWWAERLAGASALDLPVDRARPPVQTYRGGSVTLHLEPPLALMLEALAHRGGATHFALLLTGFQILLQRYSGQDDFVVGSPTVGRDAAVFSDVVGYFVNPLPLRTVLRGDPTFTMFLAQTRETALAAFAHQACPFPKIAAALQPERDPARSQIFQVLFVLQKAARPEEEALAAFALGVSGARLDLSGLIVESLPRSRRSPQLDLTLAAARFGGEIVLSLEHNADLFDPETASRMLRHLAHLLTAAAARPEEPVSHLPLLAPAERDEILHAAVTPIGAVPEVCLHELVAAQARRTPHATAIIYGRERLTYAELLRNAERLADYLVALGVGPEVPVALATQRSPALVSGMLGILASGAAYVPLDPTYPHARLAFMLEDSGAAVLVTEEALLPDLLSYAVPIVRLDHILADRSIATESAADRLQALPGNLAYLIYTSGSTGRPKAIAIEHRSATALAFWAREAFSAAELTGVLASTSVCFDLSIFEIFVPLSWGGTVILVDNAFALPQLRSTDEVTLINTVPSVAAELDRFPPSVRTICLAGEALLAPLVRRLEARSGVNRILNLYGPTEDTTYSTYDEAHGKPAPTIGRPLPGKQAHVLDAALEPLPYGVVGELWLGGSGLARGYHGRPELTAARFRPSPWGGPAGEPGARLYYTGDLVRRLPNGELEYRGRSDSQVKIRGFRIELGEIEAAITRHPAVRQAVAQVLQDGPGGTSRLVAWAAAPEAGEALRIELAAQLRDSLPQALVPQALVILNALPLTPNGKLDRRALHAPEAAVVSAYEPPITPTEEIVADILAEVLGIEAIGRHDDFFTAGLHSLSAARASARLQRAFGRELPLVAMFQSPTVAGLAERLTQNMGWPMMTPPTPVTRDGSLPLSFAQERLWFLHHLDRASAAYHVPGALEMSGPLRVPVLAAALREIVHRHEALRTAFPIAAGRPTQEITPPPAVLPLARIDLDALPTQVVDVEAQQICSTLALHSFDLACSPLARWVLLRLDAWTHRLLVVFHHIIFDGASFEVFLRELAALYGAWAADRSAPLAPLPVQFADVALWQRRVFSEEALLDSLAWWRERLADLPVLELPTDRPRYRIETADRGTARVFNIERIDTLRSFCRTEGATLFMGFLAAFSALLGRLARQTDVPLGTPISTRRHIETEGLIGMLIDTLVLRTDLRGEPTGRELLARVRRTVLEAHAHADVPFERIVDELKPERTLHGSPLFQVMFAFLQTGISEVAAGDLAIRFREVENETAKFDLSLSIRQSGTRLRGHLVYRNNLWDAATMARWECYLLTLIRGLAAAPDRRMDDLPLLPEAERHQLLVEWNDTAVPVATDLCLHELFAARAAAAPDAPALLIKGGSLSFRELHRRANRTSRRLLAMGVKPDMAVGICADRSPEMLVALLAVWKAGGAYLPLDPAQPAERLKMIIADAGARVLVTRPELLSGPMDISVVPYDELECPGTAEDDAAPDVEVSPNALAYVLYTSGSTGQPKGTLVCHRSVVHLLVALRHKIYREFTPGLRSSLRVGVNASLMFDASVKQIVQLLDGHSLVFLSEEERHDTRRLVAFCMERGLDILDCTPSQLRMILAAAEEVDAVSGLPLLLVGGEAIDENLWREMARHNRAGPGAGFWNVYGPTECTVDATACRVVGERPVLGLPIPNVRVHLLDTGLQPVPLGVPGEVCIAGLGVARGYHANPALTALLFVPNPLTEQPGERLYRTGDKARRLPDGMLEFLGREDQQIKIRGFRIELGEIEAALAAHPAVREAVVMLNGGLLVAYTTGREQFGDPGEESLRAFLTPRLPEVMLPARFVRLERLPHNSNGKVDLRAFPVPTDPVRENLPPRTELEAQIAAVWREVLGVESIGVRDNFFDMGGNSLVAVRLASRLSQELGREIPVLLVFQTVTVERLAADIERLTADVEERSKASRRQERQESLRSLRRRYRERR